MFETHDADVKLANVNMRAEIHGDEKKTAIDIKVEAQQANTVLNQFDEMLLKTFYQRAGGGDQGDIIDPNHLPQLRFPQIKVLDWAVVFEGYKARLFSEYESLDVTLLEVKVDKFKFEPRDNGIVGMSYRLRCIPTQEQIGALSQQLQGEIKLTLTPPKSDGSGAAKIKDEAVRKREAQQGQDDILDRAAEDERSALETANAMEQALVDGGHANVDSSGEPEVPATRYLDPPREHGDDDPDTTVMVELLLERGYTITVEQLEDENLIIDDDFSDIVAYLRGSPHVPPVLAKYATQAPEPEKPAPAVATKRERKKRGPTE